MTINRFSVALFNYLYYHRNRSATNKIEHYDPFFYPLDSIHHWNRIYGKSGFMQYQFVLPYNTSYDGMLEVLAEIQSSGLGSFLAVLKLFGDSHPDAIMSFPKRGYTLALDFHATDKAFQLIQKLDELVMKHGGRIYLAKDARMSAKFFKSTYEKRIQRSEKFESLQSKRLGINHE